ncbi:neutral zinc metallopeptidase [Nocardia sp. NEAU-351]|uniref:Neutral zinc metallopeptidase n=1 Tax=Nocardia bovistercoris TaxID=2785916 RepID=A0A931N6E9_9NOCA|nr:neutral zinc metallopeptidase [Nocardia bovistercoris]
MSAQEAAADFTAALNAVDAFWRGHWSQFSNTAYSPPRIVGLYDSNTKRLTCGTEVLGQNAWYCPSGDYLAFDATFMRTFYSYGDAFIYLASAHEFAHAIQNRLGQYNKQNMELQADCLAGAALAGAQRDGLIVAEKGDQQELYNTLKALGDASYTRGANHGSGNDRVAHYNLGVQNGVGRCLKL